MKRALIAATVYVALVFALGFAVGTFRVLFVVPRLGLLWATLAELPLMLIAAFFLCRWTMGRWVVPRDVATRLVVIAWFILLLLFLEISLGTIMFGQSLAEQAAAVMKPAGLIGLCGQLTAALLPLFVGRK